jgi:hypothetical protein
MSATSATPEMRTGEYTGWIASLLVIVAVLSVGAGLWFYYHP